MQCTEDGRWLEGSCEPVMCPSPPPVFHGMYHCTDGFLFDSMCWLQCQSVNSTVKTSVPCKQVCQFLSALLAVQVPTLDDKSSFVELIILMSEQIRSVVAILFFNSFEATQSVNTLLEENNQPRGGVMQTCSFIRFIPQQFEFIYIYFN